MDKLNKFDRILGIYGESLPRNDILAIYERQRKIEDGRFQKYGRYRGRLRYVIFFWVEIVILTILSGMCL